MRVLITGGAGFIGSHVADAYLAAGHDVAIVDDLSSGTAANAPTRARWHRVDVRTGALEAVFERERPDIVNHHAAQVSVHRSVSAPADDASVNVLGSINVFEAARRHGVPRVIFASTGGAIYGEPDVIPADEAHPCRPRSPYGIGKLAAERYLDYYGAGCGLEGIVLRYANVYGPRQDPHGEAGVVAIFAARAVAGARPSIFGDGEQLRDYVHVDDVVRANVAALEAQLPAGETLVVNVGTGRGTSVNALWDLAAAATSTAARPCHEPPRAGDVRRSVLDPSLAGRRLGWSARIDLAEGVRRTCAWFRERAGGRRAA